MGSEMCIRDSYRPPPFAAGAAAEPEAAAAAGASAGAGAGAAAAAGSGGEAKIFVGKYAIRSGEVFVEAPAGHGTVYFRLSLGHADADYGARVGARFCRLTLLEHKFRSHKSAGDYIILPIKPEQCMFDFLRLRSWF